MILVVDNYDSFTYNLVQMIQVEGAPTRVVRSDAFDPEAVAADPPAGIVLSPGPGRPENAGECPRLIAARPSCPVLGVCLGHQVLGISFGAVVGQAPRLMHGKVSQVRHTGEGVFRGLPDPFSATRYHSLIVHAEGLPEELVPLAWSGDRAGENAGLPDGKGSLQGMRHRTLPYWGVQFHPESVMTEAGPQLMRNFLDLCHA